MEEQKDPYTKYFVDHGVKIPAGAITGLPPSGGWDAKKFCTSKEQRVITIRNKNITASSACDHVARKIEEAAAAGGRRRRRKSRRRKSRRRKSRKRRKSKKRRKSRRKSKKRRRR